MLKDLVYRCRSYRRFYEDARISKQELWELADLARMTASTANSQALKYRLVEQEEECRKVFDTLAGRRRCRIGPDRKKESGRRRISWCSATRPWAKTNRSTWASSPRR